MKIPKVKKISDKEKIDILQKELLRKDKLIEQLKYEKQILLKINMDKAKDDLKNPLK